MTKSSLKKFDDATFEAIALRFRALGEVSRLLLVRALQSGEKSVTDLVELTGLSQPNVSRHLAVLVAAHVVGRRKKGLNVLYRIIDGNLTEICDIICKSVSSHRTAR